MPSQFLAILHNDEQKSVAESIASELGFVNPDIIKGGPAEGADYIEKNKFSPNFILIDIGSRKEDVLTELDSLAHFCDVNTRVVVIGNINDLNLYRQLIQRGVTEYFVRPVQNNEVKEAFFRGNKVIATASNDANGKVFSIISAASGDGATTVALNVSYCLANELNNPTAIVDMDYQFGLAARNLDISPASGLKELYEHPEGSIDVTLIDKTITQYKKNMYVIASPRQLYFMPEVTNTMIANLIYTLRKRFKYVILDLPHVWTPWLSTVMRETDHNIIVAQLNIKSVTHTTRLLDSMQMNGISANKTSLLINRSGSKLKEPITAADFAMACKKKVSFYVSHDSKIMANAENQGVTAMETGSSIISRQFSEIARGISSLENLISAA